MSRNENRLGSEHSGAEAPQQDQKSILDFVLPTEFVDLPSQGKFYPKGHPLHNQDNVEIRYMTAKDTDILTSKSLLKKGVAVDRMLQSILVDKAIKVDDLLVGDKNALIVAARISGFGDEYATKVTCPNCGNVASHTFNLGEMEILEPDDDIEVSESGTFKVVLPKTGVEAECRLLKGQDEKELLKISEKRKKLSLPDELLTSQYKLFIVSLNGETDRGLVEKFVDLMPAFDASFLRKMYNRAVPNIDMKQDFTCSECDHEASIDLPFSAEFFWPE